MSKKKQIDKNIKLSEKLATFIAENPDLYQDLPSHASFVVFSLRDKELNKINQKLIQSLLQEGKQVVKAEETEDKSKPWKFIPVSA